MAGKVRKSDEGVGVDRTEGAQVRKYLKTFREFDTSGDGSISPGELQALLAKSGIVLSARQFRKFMAEIDTDGDGEVDFQEFMTLARLLEGDPNKFKNKSSRVPRQYLNPEQYNQYAALFRRSAGKDGQLDASELGKFFKDANVQVTPEKAAQLLAEVDDDGSGQLDETEFMSLLIKAMNMKRRKVGPGQCSISSLQQEGWSVLEIKKTGYECKDFVDAGFSFLECMEIFTAAELRRFNVPMSTLIDFGWDCAKAREAGFTLPEILECGVGVWTIRNAGWDDTASAAQMRKLGVDAGRMKDGGWTLSVLKMAGYSDADLRAAGFSAAAIVALQKILARRAGAPALQRQSTCQFREEMEKRLQQ